MWFRELYHESGAFASVVLSLRPSPDAQTPPPSFKKTPRPEKRDGAWGWLGQWRYRFAATSSGVTEPKLLPQLERTWLITAAICSSLN